MGADSKSPFFYNHVKGRIEEDIILALGLKKVTIVRPSLFLGARDEARFGEKVEVFMKPLGFL